MSQTTKTGNDASHYHDFTFLVKVHKDDGYTARVREMPAIIVSTKDLETLETDIKEATLDYLRMFDDEHQKALEGKLQPILESPKNGVVIEIKSFRVHC